MKMCRDPEDAKDVLQDTLLALARGVRDFRGASSLSTWLFTVARSFCIKKRRKRAPAVDAISAADHVADAAPHADEALASRQVEEAIERAIAALEPMYREVLLLRDVEGLSAKEVAEVLGIGVPAVKSRLHRARIAVRNSVAPLIGAPGQDAATSCPDVLTTFSRNLEGDISPELCVQMQDHVASCGHCTAACDSLKNTLALCRASGPKTKVPAEVQAQVRAALHAVLQEHG